MIKTKKTAAELLYPRIEAELESSHKCGDLRVLFSYIV